MIPGEPPKSVAPSAEKSLKLQDEGDGQFSRQPNPFLHVNGAVHGGKHSVKIKQVEYYEIILSNK